MQKLIWKSCNTVNDELIITCIYHQGTFLNYIAASGIRRTFDLGRSIFFLIFVDSLYSLMANAALVIAVAALATSVAMEITCSAIFYILYPSNALGLMITAQIAIIRSLHVK